MANNNPIRAEDGLSPEVRQAFDAAVADPNTPTSAFGAEEPESTAFDTEFDSSITPPGIATTNPATKQIATMALTRSEQPSGEVDTLALLQKAQQNAEALLESGQESRLRSTIALDRASRKKTELTLNVPKFTQSDMYPEGQRYQSQVAETNLQRNMASALELDAIEAIQDLAAAGDTTQARILMNRLRPEKADSAGIWQEHLAKSLMYSQLAAKFKEEDDNEGWLAAIYTGLVGVFQPSTLSYLGNVDDGAGGYNERGGFTRFFRPGSEMQMQADALGRMTAAELGEYMPKLEANIRNNASNGWVFNPDKAVELIGQFQQPLSDFGANDVTSLSALEDTLNVIPGIGIVPYRLAAKAVSIPFTAARAGARREAAASVSAAFETLVREGPEAAMAKHGMDEATIAENMLPSMINTEGGIPNILVSLQSDVNKVSKAAREMAEQLDPRATERFANPEEFLEAQVSKLNELAARYGSPVKDFEVVTKTLSDGTNVKAIKATMGDPRTGGLFATEAEAIGWRMSHGFDNDVTGVVEQTGKVHKVTPREEGYTDVVYHGTTGEIVGDIRPSIAGLSGHGVYVTKDPSYASSYARADGEFGEPIMRGASPQVYPLLVNGSKVFGYAGMHRRFTTGEVKAMAKELKIKIKDIDFLGKNAEDEILIDSDAAMKYLLKKFTKHDNDVFRPNHSALNDYLEKKGWHGVISETGDANNALVIFDGKNVKGLFDRKIVQDPSGGFANIIEVDIPETAFYTHMDGVKQGALSRLMLNTSLTLDNTIYAKGLVADQKFARLQAQIAKEIKTAYAPLSKREKTFLAEILKKGENESTWFNEEQFATLVERSMGEAPSDAMINAHAKYRVLNDLEFIFRNDGVYRDKVIRGMESVKFSAFGDEIDLDAMIDWTPSKAPKNRAYNISDDVHYTGTDLTDAKMSDLASKGYIKVRLEKPVKLKDGTLVSDFVGRKADFAARPLRREQLGYKAGGHRIYESPYQVKQASYVTQPDTGVRSLQNPNTFVMAPNIRDARRWAAKMNEARIAVKNGLSAQHLDEHIFKGDAGFPKGEDFVAKVESGFIDKDEPFEALYNREQPSAYRSGNVDLEQMLGEEALAGRNAYFRTTGRMYYSGKGDHMLDTLGDLAPTVDPFEAQAVALYNAARLSGSFGDFKVSAIERWVNKYKGLLNVRAMSETDSRSAFSIFSKAQPLDGIDFDLKQQLIGQRESIKRILGFTTESDLNYRHWMRSTAEWIIGDSDNIAREKLAKGTFWLYDNNPINKLRGLVFDMKLGLFNVGQFFIQASTMASAIALNPKHGKFGLQSAVSTMAHMYSKGDENVLEQLVKNGAHKLAGFTDAAEYKAYVRNAYKSGFFNLGDSHVQINALGPEKFLSSIGGKMDGVREAGRWFFYNVEVMNRQVAYRIAYGEALEKFGKAAWDNAQFQEFIARRSENYSFNMSNTSKAWWQTGLLSIPTQFWSYNVRMMEALLGKNFDTAAKMRLLGMNFAMAGTAGIPIVAGLTDMVKTKYGVDPDVDSMAGVLDRGLTDFMIYEMFGADINVGERWGTGKWSTDLMRDIFGYSQYNNKTFAEMVGGATYSITAGAMGVMGDAFPVALKWMTSESGSEEIDMTGDEILKMFRQISTVNNSLNAYMVYNYGHYTSSKGNTLASDIPSQDALFVALGFAPHEMDTLTVMSGYLKNRSESVKDASRVITAWRQEALARPDLFEENARKVNAYVKFLPPDIKADVLRRVQRDTDPSVYASIKDRFEQTRVREQILQKAQQNAEGQ